MLQGCTHQPLQLETILIIHRWPSELPLPVKQGHQLLQGWLVSRQAERLRWFSLFECYESRLMALRVRAFADTIQIQLQLWSDAVMMMNPGFDFA